MLKQNLHASITHDTKFVWMYSSKSGHSNYYEFLMHIRKNIYTNYHFEKYMYSTYLKA